MDSQGRIPLRRGSVCGLLLILLGLWGGLAPFVGPYLHFGYTPDKTLDYNSGRLYYSIIPAAVVLVAGILAVITRNRGVGVVGGLLAALGGAWFSLGVTFMTVVLKKNIHPGNPILHGAAAISVRTYLETFSLFTGLGVLVAIIGGIAIGRFSMLGFTDTDAEFSPFQTPSGHPETVG